jgi:hypothetical protein
LPVLLLFGEGAGEERKVDLAFSDGLGKPFLVEELREKVRGLLYRRDWAEKSGGLGWVVGGGAELVLFMAGDGGGSGEGNAGKRVVVSGNDSGGGGYGAGCSGEGGALFGFMEGGFVFAFGLSGVEAGGICGEVEGMGEGEWGMGWRGVDVIFRGGG